MPDTTSLDGLSTPRHFFSIRTLLSTVAVFAVAIALAITAAGGSYASWNSNGAVNGGTISAGTIGLTVNGATSATVNLTGTALLPGRSVVQATPLQFANTGSTPINVTSAVVFAPASASLQPHLKISLRPAVGATCTVAPDPNTLPATIAPLAGALDLPVKESKAISQDAWENGTGNVEKVVAKRIAKGVTSVLCSHGPVLPEIILEIARVTHTPSDSALRRAAELSTGEYAVIHISHDPVTPGIVAVESHGPALG